MRTVRPHTTKLFSLAAALFLFGVPSARAEIDFPAVGFWNGFLGTLNVLECSSVASASAGARLEMRDANGGSLGGLSFVIASRQSTHIVLNDFQIQDKFGSLRVDLLEPSQQTAGVVSCLTSVYRLSGTPGRTVDFAYAVPLKELSHEGTWQIANGFHPDGESTAVDNWVSIVNDGNAPLQGTIESYDDAGGALPSIPVEPVPAGGRRDLLVARSNQSPPTSIQAARFFRFVPTSGGSDFSVFAIRYGSVQGQPRFAIPLTGSTGADGCSGKPLFISTMNPAINWLELANNGTTEVTAQVDVRTAGGQQLANVSVPVGPKAQQHLLVTQLLPAQSTGVVRVRCSGSLVTNLLVYGRTAAGATEWAYAIQPESSAVGASQSLALSVNSFLGMFNYARLAREDGSAASALVESIRPLELAFLQSTVPVPPNGSVDQLVSSQFAADSIGLVSAQSTAANRELYGDLLRVFSRADGSLSTVMRVPAMALNRRAPAIRLESFVSGLDKPIGIVPAKDGSGRLFVLEQHKGIRVIQNGTLLPTPFLDLSAVVSKGGEQGVIGLAFHPQYSSNGLFYVHTTDVNGDTVIAEYRVSGGNANVADPASGRVMLTQDQPFANHNGGQLAFGPDNLLYIALGDGGSGGDPQGNGQNLNTFLGKILRIDVNAVPYAIPPSNPFASGGGKPEIYAYGLRNPFRFSFDFTTGRLFAGDVGQNTLEEIDLIVSGGNYGWNTMEGSRCFSPSTGCDTTGKILPINEYGRDLGVSVIGGYVYRGVANAPLVGHYVFGDFGSGRIWTLEENSIGFIRRELLDTDLLISSFGEDESKELYVSDIRGTIYRISSAL